MLDTKPVIVTVADFDPPKHFVRYPDGRSGKLHDTEAAAQYELDAIASVNAALADLFESIGQKS